IKRDDEALKMLARVKTAGQGTPHLNQNVGSFYVKLGKLDEAIREYEAGIQLEPSEKNYYRKRIAEALIAQRQNSNAGRIIAAILKENPKDAEARLLQGSNYLEMGEIAKAVAELQIAVQSDLGNPVARLRLANALVEQGQLALALPELQKA